MEFSEPSEFRSKKSVVLDTCFVIYELLNQNESRLLRFCEDNVVILTSFNLDELLFVSKKLNHNKKRVKDFLGRAKLNFVKLPVRPGDIACEKKFVSDFSSDLLSKVHDPSDAVLVVAAILSRSDILTRDKHHLFTSVLNSELDSYGLSVFNDITSYLDN
jgi:predicted nucleic acid-binding protein